MFQTVKRIIDWCGEFKGKLYAGFVMTFFSHIFTAMPLALAAYTIGLLIESVQNGTSFDTSWIWKSILIQVGLVFFRFLFDYFRARLQEPIGYQLTARDRLAVGDALKRVSLGYFQQVSTGNILNSITTGLSTLEGMGIRMIDNFVGGYLNFLVIFLALLICSPVTSLIAFAAAAFQQKDGIITEVTIAHDDKVRVIKSTGNGRLDAVSNAFKQYFNISYELSVYEEHSLSRGSSSKAVSYVGISHNGKMFWGVGIDADIIKSSIQALTVAVNQLESEVGVNACKDDRLNEIMNYIHTNYLTVTLDELADEFHLSKPYLSKYIKEKSGNTFGDIVKNVRMKKARALLKSGSMTVEAIAENVGYQNVEHFNRLFKKKYGMTPVQFRNSK